MKTQYEGGFLISKIHQLSRRIFTRKLRDHGIAELNSPQGRIMFVLWRQDGISIKRLAEQTALRPSTLTGMLDRLEEAGYLKRVPSPDDRRQILIYQTQKEKALRKGYEEVSAEMNKLFYAGLTARETDRFERTLRRILQNLATA